MKRMYRTMLSLGGVGFLLVSCAPGPGGAPGTANGFREDSSAVPTNAPSPQRVSGIVTAGNRAAKKRELSPQPRPGLATGWGKELASRMDYTGFVRASGKPYGGVSVIRYNDEEGARAMGVSLGHQMPGMQRAAGGLVEWGVKGRWKKLRNYFWKRGRMVVGKKGQRYSLVVKNLSRSRLEAVMSVDGLDVVDGKSATVRKRGYIVYPGKTLEVKGFRTSAEAVAAFKFSSVPNSYANLRHGDTRNVGVMGLAVFIEKGVDPWGRHVHELKRRGGARPFADAPVYRARD